MSENIGISFEDILRGSFSFLRNKVHLEAQKQVRLRALDEQAFSLILDSSRQEIEEKMIKFLAATDGVSLKKAAENKEPYTEDAPKLLSDSQTFQSETPNIETVLSAEQGFLTPPSSSQFEPPIAFPRRSSSTKK